MSVTLTDEQVTQLRGLVRLVKSLEDTGAAGYDEGYYHGQAAAADTLTEIVPLLAEDDARSRTCQELTSRGRACTHPAKAKMDVGGILVCGIHARAHEQRGGGLRPLND